MPKVALPSQSMRPGFFWPTSCSDLIDQMVPMMPNGTETKNTARQSISASTPPRMRPMKLPAIAATWLRPRAKPRLLAGNASVRIAVELANSIAPPTPCTKRQTISHIAPGPPLNGSRQSAMAARVKIDEPEVVDPDAAELVAHPAEHHDEHGGDEHVAHQHPEQVADVARLERVELDAGEDGGQRDDDDRRVDRRHQHAEGGVVERHPAVVRVVFGEDAGAGHGSPCQSAREYVGMRLFICVNYITDDAQAFPERRSLFQNF